MFLVVPYNGVSEHLKGCAREQRRKGSRSSRLRILFISEFNQIWNIRLVQLTNNKVHNSLLFDSSFVTLGKMNGLTDRHGECHRRICATL